MHRIFHIKAYEKEHGPHFNEEHARKAVMKMENEDGTRGPHWSIEETTTLASQYGITLGSKFNRYDWFVALNMVYSDYYKVIINITGSNNTKNYVEFAKAWLNDKDIDEGKMWYYYVYVMCDKVREAEMECYEKEMYKYEDDEEDEEFGRYRRGGRRMGMFGRRHMYDRDDYDIGIPVIRTIYVTSDVENSSVTYGICPKIWRQLPCEGIFLLNVTHVPSSTIPAGALVSIDPTRSSSSTTSSNTSSGAKPLINGSGDQMPTEEVSNGNRYFVYYNKNNGIFQIVNHIVTPAAPAA